MEGFLFPATYELVRPPSAKILVAEQLQAFTRATSGVDFRYAAKHGPDALRRADHRLDDRARGGGTRSIAAKIAAVIYNRLHDGMRARHRRDRAVRGRRVATADGARPREREPLQHPPLQGTAADADLQTRASHRSRPPPIRRRSRTCTTWRSRTIRSAGTSSPRASRRSSSTSRSTASDDRGRRPASPACSATPSPTRARRRCRTRRSATWGSTACTSRSACRPRSSQAAVHGLAALGASGANVTLPHKEAAALLCDSLSDEAVAAGAANTLVFRDGQIRGHLTDGLGMLDALRDEGVDPRAVRRSCWARADRRAPRPRRCSQPGRRPCACSRGGTRPRGRSPRRSRRSAGSRRSTSCPRARSGSS